MASGGFHGGSSHSGGFHSSGGGGGFHSSGSGSSSFHSSGSSRDSWLDSRSDYGSDFDSDILSGPAGVVILICGLAALFVFAGGAVFASSAVIIFSGANAVTSPVFLVCGILLFFGIKSYGRTKAVRDLLKNGPYKRPARVWSRKLKNKDATDGKSFYGEDKTYAIDFNDNDFGDENSQKVYDMVIMTPGIVWISPYKLLGFSVILFLVNSFFYEAVIPIFEKMIMTDWAFKFIDYLIFFLPTAVCLILSVYSLVIVKIKDNLLYECAKRIVDDNKAVARRFKTQEKITFALSRVWYYNICPNCGAKASEKDKVCGNCGSSLESDFYGGGKPSMYHRVVEYNKSSKQVTEDQTKEKTDK